MPTTKVNGLDIYYEVQGEGEPVLLISGTGGDHTGWEPQVKEFSKEFQCVLMDNRGTGRSDKPETGYSSRVMADDAAGVLDAAGVESAHVGGSSLGSAIAQELAINYPEKVRSLSLYSTWDRPYPHFIRRFQIQTELLKLDRPDVLGKFAILTLFSPRFQNEHAEEAAEREKTMYASSDPSIPRTPLHAILGHYDADMKHDTADRLGTIKVPTLILVGAEDPLTLPRYSEAVKQKIPHAELVMIDNADHMLARMATGRFNKVALDFLRRQKGKG